MRFIPTKTSRASYQQGCNRQVEWMLIDSQGEYKLRNRFTSKGKAEAYILVLEAEIAQAQAFLDRVAVTGMIFGSIPVQLDRIEEQLREASNQAGLQFSKKQIELLKERLETSLG